MTAISPDRFATVSLLCASQEGEWLTSADRNRVWNHLQSLSVADRQSRFGYAISDATLTHWLDAWDWEAGHMWHPHGPNDPIVALVQLAPMGEGRWEMALSVSLEARGHGWGHRLRDKGLRMAQALSPGGQVVLQGAAWNRALVRICQGATTRMEQGEFSAVFDLPSLPLLLPKFDRCQTVIEPLV